MIDQPKNLPRSIALAAALAIAFSGCTRSEEAATRFTPVGEVREVHGTVVEAKLTLCRPEPGKPGACEGTLLVEPAGAGSAGRVQVEVTRDVVLKKNGESVLLPQLRDTQVVVKYRASKEGPNVATSVVGG